MIEDLNQTKFVAQEPLLQKPETIVGQDSQLKPVDSIKNFKKPNKTKLFLIILGGTMLLLITLIAILALSRRPGPDGVSPSPSPIDQSQPINLTQLEQRLEDLDQSLTEADPARQELVFPPVNLGLRLDLTTN